MFAKNYVDVLASKTVIKLSEDTFLVPLEAHSSDDEHSVSCWEYEAPNKCNFSNNIEVLHLATIFNGGAAVVRKKDQKIKEVFYINNPDTGGKIAITF